MKNKFSPIGLCLLLVTTTGMAQTGRVKNRSAILYEPVKKGAEIQENNASLANTIPALSRMKAPARMNNASKLTVAIPPEKKQEQQFFIMNTLLLDKSILANINSNPSATADYCTAPTVNQGCCNYYITDMITNKGEWYGAPDQIFSNETDARNYYLSLKPRTPFYLPYTESTVRAGGGWYYSNGNGHGSVDYSKEASAYGTGIDPTFTIHAAANGKVVSKGWNDLFGNYLILEHNAPNGTVYRTGYFHIRDGFDHDLQMAKNVKVTSGKATERDSLYVLYANKPNPSKLQWGTNAQKIKVKVGDNVYAGQEVAFAGNTGFGGAGWGLNNNGDPNNVNTANNHLHFMLWIKSPAASGPLQWLEVDPYGVYAILKDDNIDCLQPGVNKGFKRFFAPHYPSFHYVPLEYVAGEFGYFPATGMALRSISVHKAGNNYYASGSFQYGLSPQWYCRINMNSEQYQQFFNDYSAKGFTPKQIYVCKDNNGNPLFTATWRKLEANENTVSYHNMDDAAWNAAWKKHVDGEKKSCKEHLRYEWNGVTRHAAVFSSINKGFYHYHSMDLAAMQKKFDEMSKAGFMPSDLRAEEIGGKTTFSGTWVPATKEYVALCELSPDAYQSKFDEMATKGFQLERVMAYNNSTKFIAIWYK